MAINSTLPASTLAKVPAILAESSLASEPEHGPRDSRAQAPPIGETTIAPEFTATAEAFASVATTKSVPRTPIAATGVFSRNRSFASFQ
jgi:hypothetical protein